ncbi:Phage late control gene D protein (GPD) [Andreprevotia lacus DSM 23236]|jgi:hypothetical protein|uniref:Phage late control gene D protein (GPD) n=1 Tax=Andreprevotia lacus DSM 23236 TaxID=1121001 RepID=A0A1W1X6Y2_9NEIS|nr:hypothetical protein [Andreprevotia lacus]SMC19705.1 Phage late control gene D protein (GPD) [Andreprevotia lacus DSM 23236]
MSLGAVLCVNGVPDATLDVPQEIEIVETLFEPASYRLRYGIGIVEGDLSVLADARFDPGADLGVVVKAGDGYAMLSRGPVSGHYATLVQGGAGSLVDVLGADQSVTMGYENKAALWSEMTDSTAVSSVLATYGFIPDVSTTSAMHSEDKHVLVQRETDLAFVRRLARRNGFWFWLSYDAMTGLATAHFKQPPVSDPPALDLRINVPDPNVDELNLSWDVDRAVAVTLTQLDLGSKSDIDGSRDRSPLAGLASKALADIVTEVRKQHFAVPVDDAGDLGARAEAALIDHGWFVQATVTCKQSVLKNVLRAHSVVQLTGAGSRHSGNYLVARVVHKITADDHVMTAELIRNGWN